MAHGESQELVELFEEFYRSYYREAIGELAQNYPSEQRSLYVDWQDLFTFDQDLGDDYLSHPDRLQNYAEEALRLYDLPVDVSLGQAHVRVHNLPESTKIEDIQSRHRGTLISVTGVVRKATDVHQKLQEAAFECQRCGTLTRIPQTDEDTQEPHECQGCERQGPFSINFDQSELVDAQTVHLFGASENSSKSAVPQEIKVILEDDITRQATAGDNVRITGIPHLEDEGNNNSTSTTFSLYIEGVAVESLDRAVPATTRDRPFALPDLDTYANLAADTLSTLPESAREEETKAKLITPFVEALGWNKYNSQEVRLEYTDSKTTRRPDYALFGPESESPDIVIEAKQIETNLEEKEDQLYDYIRVFSAEWGVLTNGEEFYVFRRSDNDRLPEKLAQMQIGDLTDASVVNSLKRSAFYSSR